MKTPSEGHFGTNRIIRKIWVTKNLRQQGDVQSNLEFGISVKIHSAILNDYRHFSRFWVSLGLMVSEWHNGVVLGIWRVSGQEDVSVGTRA
tara:strand:+ start:428 stop:700 length:273 start_codon:yes stop_codon:yes gene_type:complete